MVPAGLRPVVWLSVSRGVPDDGGVVVAATAVVDGAVVGATAVVGELVVGETSEVVGETSEVVVKTSEVVVAMVVGVSLVAASVVNDAADPPGPALTGALISPHDATTIAHATASSEGLRVALRRRATPLVPLKPMFRRSFSVGVLLMVVVLGCSDANVSTPAQGSFILSEDFPLPVVERDEPRLPTVTTGADDEVVKVTDASRIIVLNEAIAEIVVSLGLSDSIIGRDATTTLAALAGVPEVSNGHDISAESVLSLRPSVVIGDTRTGPPEALEQLRGAGIAVLIAPEVWTLSALAARVQMIADALGVPAAGRRLAALSDDAVAAALENAGSFASVPRVAFLYVRGTASVYLLGGSGSGADELVAATGAIDVGALNGLASFTPLTAEAIVQADPDVLLVMTRGLESVGGIDGLLALPGVSSTRAATARAVIAVDDDLLLSFGPRTGALITRLAELLDAYSSDA